MKKLFIFLISTFMIFTTPLFAHDKPMSWGGGGFTIGYAHMDVSALEVFVPVDLRDFSSDQLIIGGMGHGFIGNFVIGGSEAGLPGDNINADSIDADPGGGYGS